MRKVCMIVCFVSAGALFAGDGFELHVEPRAADGGEHEVSLSDQKAEQEKAARQMQDDNKQAMKGKGLVSSVTQKVKDWWNKSTSTQPATLETTTQGADAFGGQKKSGLVDRVKDHVSRAVSAVSDAFVPRKAVEEVTSPVYSDDQRKIDEVNAQEWQQYHEYTEKALDSWKNSEDGVNAEFADWKESVLNVDTKMSRQIVEMKDPVIGNALGELYQGLTQLIAHPEEFTAGMKEAVLNQYFDLTVATEQHSIKNPHDIKVMENKAIMRSKIDSLMSRLFGTPEFITKDFIINRFAQELAELGAHPTLQEIRALQAADVTTAESLAYRRTLDEDAIGVVTSKLEKLTAGKIEQSPEAKASYDQELQDKEKSGAFDQSSAPASRLGGLKKWAQDSFSRVKNKFGGPSVTGPVARDQGVYQPSGSVKGQSEVVQSSVQDRDELYAPSGPRRMSVSELPEGDL